MIKAVLFDFDETLQDRTKAFEGYMDAFLKKYLPDLDEETNKKYKAIMYTMTKGISNIFNNEVLNISKINNKKCN
ncbi:MAG: hypothetical protein KHY24_06955 [Clostridiales bacterium]|nr:hypothetical protein [Clostridiales bacterium]